MLALKGLRVYEGREGHNSGFLRMLNIRKVLPALCV